MRVVYFSNEEWMFKIYPLLDKELGCDVTTYEDSVGEKYLLEQYGLGQVHSNNKENLMDLFPNVNWSNPDYLLVVTDEQNTWSFYCGYDNNIFI